jgi:aminopeptidase N
VKLKANQTNDDLRFLMVHDTDDFNRWDSGQTYMLRMLGDMMDRQMNSAPSELIETLGQIVQKAKKPESDPAFMARMLSLPDISIIGQSRDVVDPDEIYRVRKMVMDTLARIHHNNILDCYYDLTSADVSGAFNFPHASDW